MALEEFRVKEFKLDRGDFALLVNNAGLANPNSRRELRPLLVRCMEKLEELASTKFNVLSLSDFHRGSANFSVLGAYLSPWQKFPQADVYHDSTISLPNIEVIPQSRADPIRYWADRVAVGLWDIKTAFGKMEGYEGYADLIELQMPENLRSGLVTDVFQLPSSH